MTEVASMIPIDGTDTFLLMDFFYRKSRIISKSEHDSILDAWEDEKKDITPPIIKRTVKGIEYYAVFSGKIMMEKYERILESLFHSALFRDE